MKSANILAFRRPGYRRDELDFLPAALELVERPPSPAGHATAAIIICLVLISLGWASFGFTDIIAVAPGQIVPTGRVKMIQPLDAGIVKAINVRDGDKVARGEVLVELDNTINEAELNRVRHELMKARLDVARLTALQAGLGGDLRPVDFRPPEGAAAYEIDRARSAMSAQANRQIAKLKGLDQQIAEKRAEADTNAALIGKIEATLPMVEETADIRQKAMKIEFGNRIAFLDAQLKLSEQRHELLVQQSHAAEISSARAALEAQKQQAQSEYAQSVVSDLADSAQKAAQLAEDQIKANRKVEDQILRSPTDGTVQQLAIHTVGGVVKPGDTLLVVVPLDASIEVEAMVSNKDIGFIRKGDEAEVKVETFNFTRYGLLHGHVTSVSSDAISREFRQSREEIDGPSSDRKSPESLSYAARIQLDSDHMQVEDQRVALAPGMSVTAEIKTGQRRIISYLLSPLLRYKQESLRER